MEPFRIDTFIYGFSYFNKTSVFILCIREVWHQYENDNEHVITLWVRASKIMTSSCAISGIWFRQVREVPNEHEFVDLLRYVGIFCLQMLHHLII
jgi:hypothetical protein